MRLSSFAAFLILPVALAACDDPADPCAEFGCDVSDRAALTDHPIDQQQPPADIEAGITVGHENLRVGVGLRQATSHSEVLVRSTRLAATNVLAGYS